MTPFLPELPPVAFPGFGPVTPGASAPGVFGLPGAALPEAGRAGTRVPVTGLDFAGLLDAALPGGDASAPVLSSLPATVPPLTVSAPAEAHPVAGAAAPELSDTLPVAPPAPASAVLLREPPQPPATRLPPGTILPGTGEGVPLAAPVEHAAAPIAPAAAARVIAVQLRAEPSDAASAEPDGATIEVEADADAPLPDPSTLIAAAQPLVPPLTPPPAPPPAAAPLRAMPAVQVATRTAEPRVASAPAPLTPTAALTLPETGDDTAASTAPAPLPGEAQPASASVAAASHNTPPAAPGLAPQPTAAPVVAERAEPRAPAVDQESTIAAVGEIRAALRAVRPEMTLRHAEFGAVSLRIEGTGAQDWRAVLASRDPGFVPAIQAALAERAVTASADTAGAGAGANPGQNGTSDPRYGASPNGGQGSSQPYLGHSSGRDEGGSAQSRQSQHSTTDAVASRAGEGQAEPTESQTRGVFA